MTGHRFLTLVVLLALSMRGAVLADEPSETRPNVLFIAIDDLRPELGCYGQRSIRSPNIDRLAKSGVTFDRAYCQLAVCNPSRVSLMTGLRPDTTRVWDLVTQFRDTIPDAVTIPKHFINHGYHAISFGKIFHNPWPDNQSWSEPHAWPKTRTLWSSKAKNRLAEYRRKMADEGKPQRKISRMRAQATEVVDTPEEKHSDGAIAEQAIAAMRRLAKEEKPFFLATGFVRPHLPFVVPRKYWDMYDEEQIPLAVNQQLPTDSPSFAMNTMYELRDYLDFAETSGPRDGSLSLEQQRRLKHGYYASVSFIDSLVGRLLAELDQLELADNTIVVLWSDHGWKLGEHNSWCKQTNHEIDARVPLIIRAPGSSANGQTSDALVELVDLYPTLCELAKLPILKELEGRSVAPLLSNPDQSWKQAAFSQFRRTDDGQPLMGYSMRTDRYRYIEWQNRRTRKVVATELYDHRQDPQETTNVAGDISNKELLAKLSKQLWTTLPKPPAYIAPKPAKASLTFRNRGRGPLTVFLLKPDGGRQRIGIVQRNTDLQQTTTVGQRFFVESTTGFKTTVRVTRTQQTVSIQYKPPTKPNIVFCMADDWSWQHAGVQGDPVVKTPHFDRIANEGVRFENAFVSTPSCTPSRLSILTGQHHWRLKEGDSLGGSLRTDFDVYTDVLKQAGYRIGRYGKGVWPSQHTFRNRDSFGERFESFHDFIEAQKPGQPFCFWHGGQDPHRPYDLGVGERNNIDPKAVKVPACLPDSAAVRGDIADYLWEVQRFDREVGGILQELTAKGILDNTIVVVSGDNGMPFPRCKATLYDHGTRVPLAIRWGAKVDGGLNVTDFVSLCDLAPTFLQAAGLTPPPAMTGKSLINILKSKESGRIESARSFALTGMEKHVYAYPSRALRTDKFLYIRNFGAAMWPTGEAGDGKQEFDFASEPWPTVKGAFSFNIDPSPTKQFLRMQRSQPVVQPLAQLAFAKRANEELYDLANDPEQISNVAKDKAFADILGRLRQQLETELAKTDDPRFQSGNGKQHRAKNEVQNDKAPNGKAKSARRRESATAQ